MTCARQPCRAKKMSGVGNREVPRDAKLRQLFHVRRREWRIDHLLVHGIESDPAVVRRDGRDPAHHAFGRVRPEVHQQPFRQERRRASRVEPCSKQPLNPVTGQIHSEDAPVTRRLRVHCGQHRLFDIEHIVSVQFVDDDAGGPGETKCAGIHACGEEHDLRDRPVANGVHQTVVEEASTQGEIQVWAGAAGGRSGRAAHLCKQREPLVGRERTGVRIREQRRLVLGLERARRGNPSCGCPDRRHRHRHAHAPAS